MPVCPKCKSDMVLRTARRGPRAGSRFWGCSYYPTCRGTRNFEEYDARFRRASSSWLWSLMALALVGLVIVFGGRFVRSFGQGFVIAPTVIDGDTVHGAGKRIRLHGIDAPESAQSCTDKAGRRWSCGAEATAALETLLGGSRIECRETDIDRYGRIVAICYKGEIDINAWLVRNGWAVAYTRYSFDYLIEEMVARFYNRGIWAGDFVTPEVWRRRN